VQGRKNEVHGNHEYPGNHEAVGAGTHTTGDCRQCELWQIDGKRCAAALSVVWVNVAEASRMSNAAIRARLYPSKATPPEKEKHYK
jgi:hypothetical protein